MPNEFDQSELAQVSTMTDCNINNMWICMQGVFSHSIASKYYHIINATLQGIVLPTLW